MGKATTIVTPELRNVLSTREDINIIRDEEWCGRDRFLEVLHPDAPDGRHVDVILDEEGLRFKPDQDV